SGEKAPRRRLAKRDRLSRALSFAKEASWSQPEHQHGAPGMSNFKLGFVIFPDLTQLDLTGPLQVLARLPDSTTFIVGKSDSPVPSDCGLSLVPTHTFANCPALDLICIPGGVKGVIGAIGDHETIDFVRRQ